jgi:hypothetical protein
MWQGSNRSTGRALWWPLGTPIDQAKQGLPSDGPDEEAGDPLTPEL